VEIFAGTPSWSNCPASADFFDESGFPIDKRDGKPRRQEGGTLFQDADEVPNSPIDVAPASPVDLICTPALGGFAVDVPATGMNAALRRPAKFDVVAVPLLERAGFVPAWKPYWPKPKTVGLTFPEGLSFLSPKNESEPSEKRIPLPIVPNPHAEVRPRTTRIRPPSDALSLEDRLFYVL